MKPRLLLTALFALAAIPAAQSAVVYSGVQNIPVPFDFAGVYVRIDTHATSVSEPADWNTAPWINPFFGGVNIGSSAFLRPVVIGTDQVRNLAPGTIFGVGSIFTAGESGSTTHIGPASNQFQVGTTGYVGYRFQLPGGGGLEYYGWMGIQPNSGGAGTIVDWAYQNTASAAVAAGSVAPVPEPMEAMVLLPLAVLCAGMCIRRHRIGSYSS